MGEGVVERDLYDAIYAISVNLATVDTGMDELESEGEMFRERRWAGKGGALSETTDATEWVGGRVCGDFPGGRAWCGEYGGRGGDGRRGW